MIRCSFDKQARREQRRTVPGWGRQLKQRCICIFETSMAAMTFASRFPPTTQLRTPASLVRQAAVKPRGRRFQQSGAWKGRTGTRSEACGLGFSPPVFRFEPCWNPGPRSGVPRARGPGDKRSILALEEQSHETRNQTSLSRRLALLQLTHAIVALCFESLVMCCQSAGWKRNKNQKVKVDVC